MHYYLDENKNVCQFDPVIDGWKESIHMIVGQTPVGKFLVSTVFLGIDPRFDFGGKSKGSPKVFETMVFDATGDDVDCLRYATWKEAEAGHQKVVRLWSNL